MKKIFVFMLFVIVLSVTLTSCKDEKKPAKAAVETTKEVVKEATEVVKEVAEEAVEVVEGDNAEVIKKGKKIAMTNGCLACHKEYEKSVGPSYEEVAKVYKEKEGNMTKFLKGNADAIVDPPQFAVMKVNIPITQKLSGDDLAALTTYIRSFE